MNLNRRQFISSAALPLYGVNTASESPATKSHFWTDDAFETAVHIERAKACYQLQFFRRSLLPILLGRLSDDCIAPEVYGELKLAYVKIADILEQVLLNKVGYLDTIDQENGIFGALATFNNEQRHRVWIPRLLDPSDPIAMSCLTRDPKATLKFFWRFPSITTLNSKLGLVHLHQQVLAHLDEPVDKSPRSDSAEASLLASLQTLSNEQLIRSFSRMPLETYFALIPTMYFFEPNSPIELLTIHRERIVGIDQAPNRQKMYDEATCRVDSSRLCGEVMQVIGCNDILKMRKVAKLNECDGSWMCFHPGMILEMLYFKVLVIQYRSRIELD